MDQLWSLFDLPLLITEIASTGPGVATVTVELIMVAQLKL
jgi:hypothetical protein